MASFKAIAAESLKDLVKNSDVVKPDIDDNRVHKYKLNDKATKGKLVKGAKRDPFAVIENSLSSNLDFSLGAWNYVVLPTVRYWNQVKDDKTCKVGDTLIKIASVELGKEAGGRHIDSKVIFYANKDKVVCHLYNTTQRILVNGNGYDFFIDTFLKPYFKSKISQNIESVEKFNKEALAALSGKRKAVTRPTRSVRYKPMIKPSCNQCDESFVNKSLLGAHTKSIHKRNSMNGSTFLPRIQIVDDLSLMDLTGDNTDNAVELEEICQVKNHRCDKCPNEFGTDEELKDHHEEKHSQKEPIIYNCGKCEQKYFTFSRLAEHIDQEHKPIDVNRENSAEIEPLKSCDRSDFLTENNGDLDDHIDHEQKPCVEKETSRVQISDVKIEPLKSCEKCDFATEDVEEFSNHNARDIHDILDQNKSIADDIKNNVNVSVPTLPKATIKCRKCQKDFENEVILNKHMQEDHIIVNVYNCTSCEYKTTTKDELRAHVVEMHHY